MTRDGIKAMLEKAVATWEQAGQVIDKCRAALAALDEAATAEKADADVLIALADVRSKQASALAIKAEPPPVGEAKPL